LGYEPERRNRCFTVPTLEFKFNFTLPEPRKMRIIAKRDEYGRIIRSIPPEMSFEPASKTSYATYKAKQIFLSFVAFEATLKITQSIIKTGNHQTPVCVCQSPLDEFSEAIATVILLARGIAV